MTRFNEIGSVLMRRLPITPGTTAVNATAYLEVTDEDGTSYYLQVFSGTQA